MWDGDTCPCDTFGLDRDNLPLDGTFTVEYLPQSARLSVEGANMDPVVNDFINERKHYITAIENCAPENTADYWRWQGHAEARRQLSERLS
jgi:hypothetical protein